MRSETGGVVEFNGTSFGTDDAEKELLLPKLGNVTTPLAELATCPVCHGRGHHYFGFYLDEPGNQRFNSGGPNTTRCRSCNGRGVINV